MNDRCNEPECACRDTDTEPPIPLTAMTLRDHFAACALSGMLASPSRDGELGAFAEDAYAFADAMLAERAKGGPK